MLHTSEVPDKIMELRKLLRELEESHFCQEHECVDVRVWSQDCIMNMLEELTKFNSIFNNSL